MATPEGDQAANVTGMLSDKPSAKTTSEKKYNGEARKYAAAKDESRCAAPGMP